MVPAVALSEFLVGCEPDKVELFCSEINKFMTIAPYDAAAAIASREILAKAIRLPKESPEFKGKRHCLKVDAMVLGTALARGASKVISHDKGMAALAAGLITVEKLPELSQQLSMFGMESNVMIERRNPSED